MCSHTALICHIKATASHTMSDAVCDHILCIYDAVAFIYDILHIIL